MSYNPPRGFQGGYYPPFSSNNAHTASLCPPPPAYPLPSIESTTFVANTSNNSEISPLAKRRRIEEEVHHHCDICNISVDSAVALQAHVDSHIQCPQCAYIASPKLVKAHRQSVHGKFAGNGFKTISVAVPGCQLQRFRILVGDHPADIKKWIAERRKKFPRRQPLAAAAAMDTTTKKAAISGLLDGYGSSSSSDNDDDNGSGDQANKASDDMCKVVGEGKDDDTNEMSQKVGDDATSRDARPSHRTRICKYFARNGACRNGENCNFSHDVQTTSSSRQGRNLVRTRECSSTTLLGKLLKPDMDRETTLTLQLLSYIVDCNYLQGQQQKR